MSKIGAPEIVTQERVKKLLADKDRLGYDYLGNWEDAESIPDIPNILDDRFLAALKARGVDDQLAAGALAQLKETASDLSQGLYQANLATYTLIRYGATVVDKDGNHVTVCPIDFEHPAQNHFAFAEEVTIHGVNTKRPDIVLYVNGIALGVIELKKSSASVEAGVRQNLDNQKGIFVESFFSTIQFAFAGNSSEGLRYGTIGTAAKYYLEWKPDGFKENPHEADDLEPVVARLSEGLQDKLDRQLVAMLHPARFLALIHDFIIFDKGVKKICRYNQYFAICRAQKRLAAKTGGIVWHSQGSGKSLTMVWLSKWIKEHDPAGRVLIVTDREELDDQIEKLYKGVNEEIVRAKSGKNLIGLLGADSPRLMCSLVHKFGHRKMSEEEASRRDVETYVRDLKAALPQDFSPKGNITVFVDECHRTHSGLLHEAMKAVLPNAILIGFTGTPLLKLDKTNSIKVFGGYIHTYKFKEAVRDKVVLDLRYEARDIPQEVKEGDQAKIDTWFETKTAGLNDRARAKLKERWGTLQKVVSSDARLRMIANDILVDFETIPRLANGRGNAILVADSIYSACKFYEILNESSFNFRKCAIISSYEPQNGEVYTDTTSEEEKTENFLKYSCYRAMVGIQDGADAGSVSKAVAAFEKEAKRKFVDEPNNMKLLIVVDKLLTGFDAPPCTYLYIDKHMQDHGLFQAICRVNRLDGPEKDFGYIVDYRDLFKDLEKSLKDYSSGAFDGFDAEDVEGLIKNAADAGLADFKRLLEQMEAMVEGVPAPQEEADYIRYFCGIDADTLEEDAEKAQLRQKLYRLSSSLGRAFTDLKVHQGVVGVPAADWDRYEKRVAFFAALRDTIGKASGDFLDFKNYDPGMRFLIDHYIGADQAVKIDTLKDFTLLDFILDKEKESEKGEGADTAKDHETAAETIENNIGKEMVQKKLTNPAFFEKMSKVLAKIIEERKKDVLSYRELLEKYRELAEKLRNAENESIYPESIRGDAMKCALYGNLGEDEELANAISDAFLDSVEPDFRYNFAKQQKIRAAIYQIVHDTQKVEEAYNLICEQNV